MGIINKIEFNLKHCSPLQSSLNYIYSNNFLNQILSHCFRVNLSVFNPTSVTNDQLKSIVAGVRHPRKAIDHRPT